MKKPSVFMEVLTTPQCTDCQKALSSAKRIAKAFGDSVFLMEVDTSTEEGGARAAEYGVRNVPTIAINGRLAFEGVPQQTLLKKVVEDEIYREKNLGYFM
jgi:glutaredoxin